MVKFKINKISEKIYEQPLYTEQDGWGTERNVTICSNTGYSTYIGCYNPSDYVTELPVGELMKYLVEYKNYKIIATTPITSGKGYTVRNGAGESHIETKIVYSLIKS